MRDSSDVGGMTAPRHPAHKGSSMTTEDERKKAAADRLLWLDEVEASISAFKKAVVFSPKGSLSRQPEASR